MYPHQSTAGLLNLEQASPWLEKPHSQDIKAIVTKLKMSFGWNESYRYWWIEGNAYDGKRWHSGYWPAESRQDAEKEAYDYLKGFISEPN